ncbi:MAG: hypothetical protein M1831_006814 [Alyxoria varia]|nr:MAG: hypothetical protein M1831_006814 [Alyxoria varia]
MATAMNPKAIARRIDVILCIGSDANDEDQSEFHLGVNSGVLHENLKHLGKIVFSNYPKGRLPPNTDDPPVVDLPEEDREAMETLMRFIHGRSIDDVLNPGLFLKVSLIAWKWSLKKAVAKRLVASQNPYFDCNCPLHPWGLGEDETDVISHFLYLCAAYYLKDQSLFGPASHHCIRQYSGTDIDGAFGDDENSELFDAESPAMFRRICDEFEEDTRYFPKVLCKALYDRHTYLRDDIYCLIAVINAERLPAGHTKGIFKPFKLKKALAKSEDPNRQLYGTIEEVLELWGPHGIDGGGDTFDALFAALSHGKLGYGEYSMRVIDAVEAIDGVVERFEEEQQGFCLDCWQNGGKTRRVEECEKLEMKSREYNHGD